MGLRFRKSVQLFPGVRLNFGKSGMSVSAGVPGFRKTIHTSGRVTTSVGIPGTGIYYVDTKKPNRDRQRNNTRQRTNGWDNVQSNYNEEPLYTSPDDFIQEQNEYIYSSQEETVEPVTTDFVLDDPFVPEDSEDPWVEPIEAPNSNIEQVNPSVLRWIHKTSDDSVDWTEVLVSPLAPDESYNQEMWSYYHSMAEKILAGDIDSYLQLIYEVNPLDDLLAFGGSFEFGTDNPKKIEVEFVVNEESLSYAKEQLNEMEFNNLLQDYVCSVCIRIARDMFALLPISNSIVHASIAKKTILSVDFDRATLGKLKFGFIDPSDTISGFRHNMRFSNSGGFEKVDQIL